jgi:hypothetical protein
MRAGAREQFTPANKPGIVAIKNRLPCPLWVLLAWAIG